MIVVFIFIYSVNERWHGKLFFSCRRCGHCCSGRGGIVVGPRDLLRLADFFRMSAEEFLERHTENISRVRPVLPPVLWLGFPVRSGPFRRNEYGISVPERPADVVPGSYHVVPAGGVPYPYDRRVRFRDDRPAGISRASCRRGMFWPVVFPSVAFPADCYRMLVGKCLPGKRKAKNGRRTDKKKNRFFSIHILRYFCIVFYSLSYSRL